MPATGITCVVYANIKAVEWATTPPLVVGSRAAFVAQFLDRRIAATPEGWTRMTLRNRGIPTGFSRLMAPLMSLAIRRATQKDLARLKALVEQGS